MDPQGSPPPHSDAPVAAQVVNEHRIPAGQPATRRRGGGGKTFFILLLLGALTVSILANLGVFRGGISLGGPPSPLVEKHHSLSKSADDKVAIIRVEGTILSGTGYIKHQIEKVLHDESVKAIVLRVNSPGGTVTGSDYILHHLNDMLEERDIPLVVSMGSLAASGGYYVSMAVGDTPDSIFAEPTTWTGSIGVIIPHYSLAGLMDEWKIVDDSIKSHPLKGLGSFTTEMTEEERAVLQGLVDESFEGFKEIVRSGRPQFQENPGELDVIATGQVFTANQAIENGLVDQTGFIEDAIGRALELANLDEDDAEAVEYEMPRGLFDEVLFGPASESRGLASLLDMSAPRAYYLFSWMPAVLSNQHH